MSRRAQVGIAVAALLAAAAAGYAVTHDPGGEPTRAPEATADARTDAGVIGADAPLEARHDASPPPPTEPEASETFAPDTETVALLGAPPGAARVLVERRSGRDLYVLAAIDRAIETDEGAPSDATAASDDEATPGGDDALVDGEIDGEIDDETDDEDLDEEESAPCEALDGQDDAWCDCIVRGATSEDAGYREALGQPVVRIEIVRIHDERAGRSVRARQVLTGPVLYELDPDDAPELRVNDVDHDGRVEVTALVSFAVPDCDTFQEEWGRLGVILDGGDLHPQAVFAREHLSSGGDSDVNSVFEETVWRVVPGPPFDPSAASPLATAQLEVRRTERSSFMEAEDEEPTRAGATDRWTCPYDVARDRWTCPDDSTALTAWVSTVCPLLASSDR